MLTIRIYVLHSIVGFLYKKIQQKNTAIQYDRKETENMKCEVHCIPSP
jgi:hypothetical protein